MTGWFLVWILIVRTGTEFVILPHELPQPSFDSCIRAKIEMEKTFTENPVDWGDFTSFDVGCEYRGIGFNDPNDYSVPPITEEELTQ